MSSRLRIEITVDYEDNVSERDRLQIDHRIDAMLKTTSFSTSGNVVEDDPEAVSYTVYVV